MDPKQQLAILDKEYPDAKYYLDFDTPFHLLLATILSAQCTDVIVNKTTPALFRKYKRPEDILRVSEAELASDIRTVTFYAAKAKNIRRACETLVKEFGGEVPKEIDQLVTLGGVGRKTANAIQQNAFGTVNGIIVDTHVIRLAQRLGWTRQRGNNTPQSKSSADPEKIEQELMRLFPKAEWKHLPHLLKTHGQRICTAKKARCENCPLSKSCPSAFKV
jgi:endonuclease-3